PRGTYISLGTDLSRLIAKEVGDDLRVVGSGPSIGAVGNPAQAAALLKKADVWHAMPPATRTYLTTAQAPPMQHAVHATLIASNATSAQAVADYLATKMQTAPLIGDVEQAAQRIVNDALAYSTPLVYGGETTVELSKVVGKGGRNQELALRVVRLVKRAGLTGDWCFLSGGTDGRDGPTDAAGGLVDHTSFARLEAASIDLDRVLERHDSYPALAVIDDLLMTGATGTNVADLQIFLRPSPKT
ncbi:MAG: glycerate kinase, partial [Rhodobacteraceae bacterium]